jgi:16S rRNA (uracil1498-N3)-methyltransferase
MTPCAFSDVVSMPGAVLADMGGEHVPSTRSVVLIGPEGGWSQEERACGLPTVTLGDGVLRAETAAIAAGVLVTAARRGRPGVHER